MNDREIEGLIARQVDSIVLASVRTFKPPQNVVFQQLTESRVPYVLIDQRNFPELSANYVGVDDTAVGRAARQSI